MRKRECIELNEIKYFRYPHSKRRNDSVYFKCLAHFYPKGFRYYHRDLWKSRYGPIPPGHVIHHKDDNPLNNAIENLMCIGNDEHMSWHSKDRFFHKKFRERN